jgi:hypothetical protein
LTVKSWNSIQRDNKVAFYGGHINYLDRTGYWHGINCLVNDSGGSFEVNRAPFEFQAPQFADGEAYIAFKNRYDVLTKTRISVPNFNRFQLTIRPQDVSHVAGETFDINGDGRLDAIKYPNAYADGDLIYYIHQGRIPKVKTLSTINSTPAGNVSFEHKITISGKTEITPGKRPDGVSRAEFRDSQRAVLDTPAPLSPDNGFLLREWDNSDQVGFDIMDATAWDSNGTSIPVAMTIRRDMSGGTNDYILKKTVLKANLSGATYPVFVDPTFTFTSGVTAVDGEASQSVSNDTWANTRDGLGTNASSGSGLASIFMPAMGTTTDRFNNLGRGFFLFDTSSLGGASIESAKFTVIFNGKTDTSGIAPTFNMYSSAPVSDTALVAGDFDSCGITPFASDITFASITTGVRTDFNFVNDGITAIDGTGITKLSMRNANYDVADIAPTWTSSAQVRMDIRMSENIGSEPTLEVTTLATDSTTNPVKNPQKFPFKNPLKNKQV